MTSEHRSRLTARTRILGWIMLIVTIAVAVIVVATAKSMFSRVDAQVETELEHESAKLHTLADGTDPGTGDEFRTVRQVLQSHLMHNVPEEAETFFSVVDGSAHLRSPGEPPARLDRNAEFVAEIARADEPDTSRVDTDEGVAEYAVIPVRVAGDPEQGALVIVEFLAPRYDEVWETITTMTLIAVFALFVAGIAGWLVAGRVLAPIRSLRETADGISESDFGQRIEVSGSDDVAQLAATFNSMLDRLQSAFAGQRRFLDDAGHELRTPITVVRGHLEVMGDDPAEREQTVRLVDDELERMSRLVDDLIMLARSERPGFLIIGVVQLTDLVVETFTKATALAARTWSIEAVPHETARADEQRLAQALLQLASNAVAHTDEGDHISIGGSVEHERIRLWVSDDGGGIHPDEHARIFERFSHLTAGRGEGSGLGLAIVARIAEAHGGTVAVRSTPGAGATFTLDLPFHPEENT